MIEISGTTRIFPVIGWPVEQVKAPALFNAYFMRHGIDARRENENRRTQESRVRHSPLRFVMQSARQCSRSRLAFRPR